MTKPIQIPTDEERKTNLHIYELETLLSERNKEVTHLRGQIWKANI